MRRTLAALLVSLLAPVVVPSAQQRSFESVVADLASPDAAVRGRAVALLASTGYPEALVPVAARMRDADDGVQLAAIAATLTLLVERPLTPAREGRDGAASAFDDDVVALTRLPADVAGDMVAAMGDASPVVRREAAFAFAVAAGTGAPATSADTMAAAARALTAMLTDADADVRVAAGRVAGRLFKRPLAGAGAPRVHALPAETGDALIAQLNAASELERLVAMEALGLTGEARAVTALAERFVHHRRAGPPLEMAAALDALARLGHPSSLPFFVEAWSDRWETVRMLAYEGLARTDARAEAAPLLARRPAERDARTALAQAFAHERLLADGSLARLVDALRSRTARDQARGYLVELGPAATPALVAALRHQDAGVRAEVAAVLGRVGTPDAVRELRALALDRDRTVVAAAAAAVRRIEAGLSAGASRQP